MNVNIWKELKDAHSSDFKTMMELYEHNALLDLHERLKKCEAYDLWQILDENQSKIRKSLLSIDERLAKLEFTMKIIKEHMGLDKPLERHPIHAPAKEEKEQHTVAGPMVSTPSLLQERKQKAWENYVVKHPEIRGTIRRKCFFFGWDASLNTSFTCGHGHPSRVIGNVYRCEEGHEFSDEGATTYIAECIDAAMQEKKED